MPQVLFDRTLTCMSFLGHCAVHKSSAEEQYLGIVTAAAGGLSNEAALDCPQKRVNSRSHTRARERSCHL